MTFDLTPDPEVTRTQAKFTSKCAYCGEVIYEDDCIILDDDGNWVHEDCMED